MNCTRCGGTGFLNTEQLPDDIDGYDQAAVLRWMKTDDGMASDVSVCDCCGDMENWHGVPGEHYSNDDPSGPGGPYAYNGGLAECH